MATEESTEVKAAQASHTSSTADGLFVRNATGLVREISQRDNFMLAALSAAPASLVAITVFFALGGLPGGNLFIAGLLCIPLTVAFSFAFGLMSSVIPRSGGDYTVVSRILSPQLGFISTVCMVIGGFAFSAAAIGRLFDTLAVAPSFQTIGVVAHSHTFVDWGNTLLTSKPWQFVIGSLMFVLAAAAHLGGPHRAKRVWNALFIISTSGLIFCALVALFTSQHTFMAHFNALASPFTHSANSYADVIAAATKGGVNVHPPLSMAATIPVIGVFAGSAIYTWFGSFAAGELRQAATRRTAHRMAAGGIFSIALTLVVCAIFFHSWGKPFVTAAFGGGFPAQLGTLPAYFTLTSYQIGNTLLAIVLCLSFCVVFPMTGAQLMLGLTRVLFAWSFDGILPDRVAKVSSRTHAPTTAVLISLAIFIGFCAWGVWDTSSIIQIVVYTTIIGLLPMMLVGVAGIALPWRRPELYRASGVTTTLAGVPLVVISGLSAIAGGVFVIWLYFHYSFFGLANTGKFFAWAGGIIAVGIAYYVGAKWVKRRQGVDLSLVYSEIPPE